MRVNGEFIKLSKEEAIYLHRKLWNTIADKIENGYDCRNKVLLSLKCDCITKVLNTEDWCVDSGCFLCDYSDDIAKTNEIDEIEAFFKRCNYCPLKWNSDNGKCPSGESLYSQLLDEFNSNTDKDNYALASIARKIANLEEKGDKK